MPVTIVVDVVDRTRRRSAEVVVSAEPGTPLSAVLAQAAPLLGPLGDDARRVAVDGRLVHVGTSLAVAGVRSGSTVELLPPSASPSVPVTAGSVTGLAEIRVIGGPGAGRVHRVSLGTTTFGFAPPDQAGRDNVATAADPVQRVLVADPPVHAVRLRVTAAVGGAVTYRLDAAADELPWPTGTTVQLDDLTLECAPVSAQEAHAVPAPDRLALDVNRPPRILPPILAPAVQLPARPTARTPRRLPWAAVLAPAVIAVPLALLLGPHYLIFAVLSPLMALSQWVIDRRTGRKDGRSATSGWRTRRQELVDQVDELLDAEERQRREEAPDPARLLLLALGPGARLWERRPGDPDRLRVRVGLATLPPRTRVEDLDVAPADSADEITPRTTVLDTPAEVGLGGVLGVAGTPGAAEDAAPRLTAWLVAQVALLHSPGDVRVVVLATGRSAQRRWGWTRWLPHLRSDDGPLALGTDADSVGRRIAELTALVAARSAPRGLGAAGAASGKGWPDVVLVLDGARQLRALPAVIGLLRDGPAVGLHVICVESEAARLPVECETVVEAVSGTEVVVRTSGADDVQQVRADLVEAAWLEEVARALAPLRESRSGGDDSAIPDRVRLLELLPALAGENGLPDPARIRSGWHAAPEYGPARVPVGVGFDGPMTIDLTRDGPHALIAGTTGSGKSELLQTLVVAAALAHAPQDLSFVLVDYKGGAAFAACADLPHTAGLVTDLDGHLVQRALASLSAELKRRERLLAQAGATELDDYTARRARGATELPSIARLVIVVDEFAALAAELPDFVTGLVGIAQRGRSLGVHLVLATQRPSGAVSADIRANTALRICLRVTDETDSRDVVDSPDAAHISRDTPGRALVSSGQSTLLPFQTARVAGPFGGLAAGDGLRVRPFDWATAGRAAAEPVTGPTTERASGTTDLDVLVAAIRVAGEGLAAPPRPWLPPLPGDVRLERLPRPQGGADPAVPWALDDLPTTQAQQPHLFAPGRSGHLYVVGTSGSGRSTALRSLAASLAATYPTADLHLHGLDCGNGALTALTALPNTGAVVSRADTTRAERLLDRLAEEIDHRQSVLARHAHADITEHRLRTPASDPDRLPHVVLLIDRWEGFASTLGELDGGRVTETVLHLLREGPGAGVQLVISGDRSLLIGRMAALVESKLLLRLADRNDYPLGGVPTRTLPATLEAGRGLWAPTGSDQAPVESQVALLGSANRQSGHAHADASGAGQSAAVADLAAWARQRDADTPARKRPFTLAPLPASVAASQVGPTFKARGPLHVPFGIGGDELDQLGIDLAAAPIAVVAGSPQTGRTTALRFAAGHALRSATPLLVISPRYTELVDDVQAGVARGLPAVAHVGADAEPLTLLLRALPPEALVFVDDADQLRDGPLAPVLAALVKQAREKQWGVVVAADTSHLAGTLTGWLPETKRHRQGLLLSPLTLADGDAVGHRLMRSHLLTRPHPGRGLLASAQLGLVSVQVPHSGL